MKLQLQGLRGLTLLEVLIALAILGVVVALMLSAVQDTREAARRTLCSANLRQIGLAIKAYESTYRRMVPGNGPGGFSLHVRLLPFLEQQALYSSIDFSQKITAPANAQLLKAHGVSVFNCPSNPVSIVPCGFTNYVGSAGGGVPQAENGYFVNLWKTAPLTDADIQDGFSNTVIMSESLSFPMQLPGSPPVSESIAIRRTSNAFLIPSQLEDLIAECTDGPYQYTNTALGNDWSYGSVSVTRFVHILPPNNSSCNNKTSVATGIYTPSSRHTGGVNVLVGDQSVRFVSNRTNRETWVALGTRNGQESSIE